MFNWLKKKGICSFGIHVFVRHCYTSSASEHKERFARFSRRHCYHNLLETVEGHEDVKLTFFLDQTSNRQEAKSHFLKEQDRFPVIDIEAGTEALSFLQMLDFVLKQKIHPEAIIYFLEDDYLHKPGWVPILKEGFTLPEIDYVTLFDHKDKYLSAHYPDLQARIFHTTSCHWRTTPSTTNTYAMRFKTLLRDAELHRTFSQGKTITADHEKFQALLAKGRTLISSLPGWSTHVEPAFASPCTDWQKM